MSIEQMVRDLLEEAIQEGAVDPPSGYKNKSPQSRCTGEIVGTANLLAKFFSEKPVGRRCKMYSQIGRCVLPAWHDGGHKWSSTD